MSRILISELGWGDVPRVAEIHAQSFDDAWDESVLRRILTMPGTFGLAARDCAAAPPDGFALARLAVDECELLSLAVAVDRRQRGFGSALLDATIARAVASNARRLFLEVAEDNWEAQRLYAARGMVQIGRRPRYYELRDGKYMDALTMRRDLSTGSTA